MKSTRIKTLVNKGLTSHAEFAAWNLKNHLFYKPIENGLLVGLYFNSSGFSPDKFEIIAFVQPLFVPSNTIDLSFGINIKTSKNQQWWHYDENQVEYLIVELASCVTSIASQFLSNFSGAASFYHFFKKNKKQSFRFFESVAYASVYAQLENAKDEVNDLLSFLRRKEDLSSIWVKEVYENSILLLGDNPFSILKGWEDKTRNALKL